MFDLIKRAAIFSLGVLLVVLGMIGIFLPIIPGIPLIIGGAFLLQYEWPWPYEMLLKIRARYPAIDRSLHRVVLWERSLRDRLRGGPTRPRPNEATKL